MLPSVSESVVGFPSYEESAQLRLLKNVLQESCLDGSLHGLITGQEKLRHGGSKLSKHAVCVASFRDIVETHFELLSGLVTGRCVAVLRVIANATQ
jgi:hypothetical protein